MDYETLKAKIQQVKDKGDFEQLPGVARDLADYSSDQLISIIGQHFRDISIETLSEISEIWCSMNRTVYWSYVAENAAGATINQGRRTQLVDGITDSASDCADAIKKAIEKCLHDVPAAPAGPERERRRLRNAGRRCGRLTRNVWMVLNTTRRLRSIT